MEANLVRILLLIALFFLLSSDYSSVVRQLIPIFDDGEDDSESNEVDIAPPKLSVEKIEHNSLKADDNEKTLMLARKKILNAVKNSCLPKLICELNAAPNKENLSQSEVSLLNLIRDTSISATAEITSKYHFAAHMGQLISGVEGTGCHNFYPDCPLPGFRVSQLLKSVKFK